MKLLGALGLGAFGWCVASIIWGPEGGNAVILAAVGMLVLGMIMRVAG